MPADPSEVRRMPPSVLSIVLAVIVAFVSPALSIELERIGMWDSGGGEGTVEIAAFDAASQRLFIIDPQRQLVAIVSLADPTAPSTLDSVDLSAVGGRLNSVAVADGLVAVAAEADSEQDPGVVIFLDVDGQILGQHTVGAEPDMLTFTADGTRVLVADEGEPNGSYTVDPPGTISILDVSAGVAAATVTSVDFADYDAGGPLAGTLEAAGVRIFGPGAAPSTDLEPEYIALSSDGATAWVTLQENNAMAVIDVPSASIVRVDALGFRDHSLPGRGLDPSDEDGAIAIGSWPVFGMFQPDAVASFEHQGETLLVTANEGDARDFSGFSEVSRVADLTLDAAVFPDPAIQDAAALGRLQVTTTLGQKDASCPGVVGADCDAEFEALYAFGARSFAIWRGSDGALLYDSGDAFEQVIAQQIPDLFNAEGTVASFDRRSDNRGPEPEGLTLGEVFGRRYVFIGLERVGGVMIWDLTVPTSPRFESYAPEAATDRSPEGLVFLSAADSPSAEPLLLVSHEGSGTLAVFRFAGLPSAVFADSFEDGDTTAWSSAQHRELFE